MLQEDKCREPSDGTDNKVPSKIVGFEKRGCVLHTRPAGIAPAIIIGDAKTICKARRTAWNKAESKVQAEFSTIAKAPAIIILSKKIVKKGEKGRFRWANVHKEIKKAVLVRKLKEKIDNDRDSRRHGEFYIMQNVTDGNGSGASVRAQNYPTTTYNIIHTLDCLER